MIHSNNLLVFRRPLTSCLSVHTCGALPGAACGLADPSSLIRKGGFPQLWMVNTGAFAEGTLILVLT